jgi:hypothetical protein
MATGRGVNQGKTTFVEDQLRQNGKVKLESINEAWSAAGNVGSISPSLVQKVRARFRLTRKKRGPAGGSKSEEATGASPESRPRRGRPRKAESAPRSNGRDASPVSASEASAVHAGDRDRVLDEVEGGIDELIFTLKAAGGLPEVEAALRAARRILSRSHGE